MSIHKSVQYSIRCDFCSSFENDREYNSYTNSFRRKGWKRRKNKWYCPSCAKKLDKRLSFVSSPDAFILQGTLDLDTKCLCPYDGHSELCLIHKRNSSLM